MAAHCPSVCFLSHYTHVSHGVSLSQSSTHFFSSPPCQSFSIFQSSHLHPVSLSVFHSPPLISTLSVFHSPPLISTLSVSSPPCQSSTHLLSSPPCQPFSVFHSPPLISTLSAFLSLPLTSSHLHPVSLSQSSTHLLSSPPCQPFSVFHSLLSSPPCLPFSVFHSPPLISTLSVFLSLPLTSSHLHPVSLSQSSTHLLSSPPCQPFSVFHSPPLSLPPPHPQPPSSFSTSCPGLPVLGRWSLGI